jgi:hypothetical protein
LTGTPTGVNFVLGDGEFCLYMGVSTTPIPPEFPTGPDISTDGNGILGGGEFWRGVSSAGLAGATEFDG